MCGGSIRRADRLDVAVRSDLAVVIVFNNNRVSSAVAIYPRRDVPPVLVGALKLAGRTELHQMSLVPVVASKGPIDHASIRSYSWRRRTIIENASRPRPVDFRIDTDVGADPATAWATNGQQHSAAVVKMIAQRGVPFQSEIWVDRDQVVVPRHELGLTHRVDGAVGRDCRRGVDRGPLRAARNGRRYCIRGGWPRKLGATEPYLARIGSRRRIGRERRKPHFSDSVIWCNSNEP